MNRKLSKARTNGKAHAFTLIDLAGFVLGIALLLWLKGARMRAQSSVCASNLHHIYVATALYMNEYDRFPGARYYTGAGGEYESDTVKMSLPGMLSPKFAPPELFWCPAESKDIRGTPAGGDTANGQPHPFWERKAGSYLKMKYAAYEVGDEAWVENEHNERLAWGLCGSTYGMPMAVGKSEGKLPLEKCLHTDPKFSFGGTIDLESVAANPEALYMVDHDQWWKSGKHFTGAELWQSSAISERHEKVNYLTFGGSVQKVSKEWLTGKAAKGKGPWFFEWARGKHK